MPVTKDYLTNQVTSLEQELTQTSQTFEQTKQNLFRLDGALALAKHMLADFKDDGGLNESVEGEVIAVQEATKES